MQEHLFSHFSMAGHNGFLNDGYKEKINGNNNTIVIIIILALLFGLTLILILALLFLPILITEVEPCTICTLKNVTPCSIGI